MGESQKEPFPRRLNADGSYDSICPRCFLTIARGSSERELDDAEQNHACELQELRRKKRRTQMTAE